MLSHSRLPCEGLGRECKRGPGSCCRRGSSDEGQVGCWGERRAAEGLGVTVARAPRTPPTLPLRAWQGLCRPTAGGKKTVQASGFYSSLFSNVFFLIMKLIFIELVLR